MRLTDEQFEEILKGQAPPADLDQADRARLTEAQAVRRRLQGALRGVRAEASLADRVRSAVRAESQRQPGPLIRLTWRLMPAAMAAAALLVVAPTVLYLVKPVPAAAATEQLTRIHQENLAGGPGFVRADDRADIEALFRRQLDFVPVVIPPGRDVRLVGGCVARIQDQPAASYLISVGDKKITIIVTRQWPKELGLTCGCRVQQCTCYHKGQCGTCNLVSRRIGDYAYTAVGKATPADLQDVLARIGQ